MRLDIGREVQEATLVACLIVLIGFVFTTWTPVGCASAVAGVFILKMIIYLISMPAILMGLLVAPAAGEFSWPLVLQNVLLDQNGVHALLQCAFNVTIG